MTTTTPTLVSAPGRLHFGMFAVGDLVERQYGGIGLMVQQPATCIAATSADRFSIVGDEQTTIGNAAIGWFERLNVSQELNSQSPLQSLVDLPVQLQLQQHAPRHFGLGSGTQLALATATALNHFFQLPMPSAQTLAVSVGRGKRSAVGSYGFFEGGFLVDQGKAGADAMASLDFQIDFPTEWPIVLIFPDQPAGLAGDQEQAAFDRIPPTQPQQYAAMQKIVSQRIVPGIARKDYDLFAEALYEFGHASGRYFETVQGGAYNGDEVSSLVRFVRDFGVGATGQTSWGPCVFAITSDQSQADELVARINEKYGKSCSTQITRADNCGATVNGTNLHVRAGVVNRLGS